MHSIILFDGVCNLCDQGVQFIIKHDPVGYFKFASLESDRGQTILKELDIQEGVNSFILVEHDRYYVESTAALRVCRHLAGPWKIGYLFLIVPPPIRNIIYRIVAKKRYKWFGKKEQCMLPTPNIRNRFL